LFIGYSDTWAQEGRVGGGGQENLELTPEVAYGAYENRRVMMHDKTLYLTLTSRLKNGSREPDKHRSAVWTNT